MDFNAAWPAADTGGNDQHRDCEPLTSASYHEVEEALAKPKQSANRYQYFFVPSSSQENGPECATKPGAFLRLGAYSDVEEMSGKHTRGLDAYYPPRHIASETGKAAYQHAAGPVAGESCGIALTCDGRMMLRADERAYIYGEELVDINSGGNITMTADDGPINISTTDSFSVEATKKVSLRSGAEVGTPYTSKEENISGEHGIEFIADEGNANIYLEGHEIYQNASGDCKTVVRADMIEDVIGNKYSWVRGRTLAMYMGYGATYRGSGSINFATSLDFNFSFVEFEFTAFDFDCIGKSIDLREAWFKVNSTDTNLANLTARVETLSTRANAIDTSVGNLRADTTRINTSLGGIRANIDDLFLMI